MTKSELIETLEKANGAYRAGSPTMTDSDFDQLEMRLRKLDPDHPFLATLDDDEFGRDTELTIAMGSQNKALTVAEMASFFRIVGEQTVLHVSEKLDGMSMELTYVDGAYNKAVTRGDGTIGVDVTQVVAKIPSVPKTIQATGTFIIRGETMMTKSALEQVNKVLNEYGRESIKNTRNGTVGLVKTLKNLPYVSYLTFKAFGSTFEPETMTERFNHLTNLGFHTPDNQRITKVEIEAYFEQKKLDRDALDYDIDGLVFSVDNIVEMESYGIENKNCPRGQVALKFPAEGAITTIRSIEWSQDGGAYVVPVAVYDPIEVMGATLQRASLKSMRWMIDNGVGIGSQIKIVRSGDVIPKIEEVLSNDGAEAINPPTHCNYCEGPISLGTNAYTGEQDANLSCANEDCAAKHAYRMNHFLDTLRVKGLGRDSLLSYANVGVTVADFFQENFNSIEIKIAKDASISQKIWAKIRTQLEQLR